MSYWRTPKNEQVERDMRQQEHVMMMIAVMAVTIIVVIAGVML